MWIKQSMHLQTRTRSPRSHVIYTEVEKQTEGGRMCAHTCGLQCLQAIIYAFFREGRTWAIAVRRGSYGNSLLKFGSLKTL